MNSAERRRAQERMRERIEEIRGRKPIADSIRKGLILPGRPSADVLQGGVEVVPWEETDASVQHRRNLSPEQKVRLKARQEAKLRAQQAEADQAFAALRANLPPVVRTTPQQRIEALVGGMIDYAKRSYAATGKVQLPESVVNSICKYYADQGHFGMTPAKIERMALDEINRVLHQYGRATQEKADAESSYRREADAHLKLKVG